MRPNLSVLRSRFATRLTEQGMVYTPGEPVMDPDPPFDMIPGPPIVHYEGPILVRAQSAQETNPVVGGYEWTVGRYDVTLPAGTPAVVGQKVKLSSCPFDVALVGVELTIVDVPLDSWQVARTLVAEVAT